MMAGIVMALFMRHSLSDEAYKLIAALYKVVAQIAETYVFVYVRALSTPPSLSSFSCHLLNNHSHPIRTAWYGLRRLPDFPEHRLGGAQLALCFSSNVSLLDLCPLPELT